MLTLDQRPRPHPDAVDTELDTGELVLLHLKHKTFYSLNSTGMRVWQGLKQGLTLREISRRLQQDFDVDPKRADSSVLRIAGDLSREELVEAAE